MSDTPSKLPMRSCRYCRAKFQPDRKDQRFCKPAHRKSFWKYGGLPFDKMKEQIMKDVRKMMQEVVREELDRRVKSVPIVPSGPMGIGYAHGTAGEAFIIDRR